MFYNKNKDGIIWNGVLITILSMSIIYFVNNPLIIIFAGLFFLLGGLFILSTGYNSETILPKLLSIGYIVIIERWLLFIFFSDKTKEEFWFFHIIFFFVVLLLYFITKHFIHIIKILKKEKIIIKEFEIESILKLPYVLLAVLWLCFGKWAINRVEMGIQNPHKIAYKIYHETSYEIRVGALCRDGWESTATGSGACSDHGGVAEWKTNKVHKKTYRQCYKEALEISWVE